MKMRIAVLGAVLVCGVALAAEPAFDTPPKARKSGDEVIITFKLKKATDVEVAILDARGKIVRHLAAGVLGGKGPPPEPLRPGLSQRLSWDGKADWGKPAGSGPFKVRVALGLGARCDKVLIADPASIGVVKAMAAGPDGTLYAVVGAGASVPNWSAQRLIALNRDGSFQRTLIPPPSSATKEQIRALGGVPVQVGGRTVPMVTHFTQRRCTAFWSSDPAAMTPDGKLLVLHPDARIGLVDTADPKTPPQLLGPRLLPEVPKASFHTFQRSYLASSGDGKYAYFSGIARQRSYSSRKTPPYTAVYRVKLPERSPAEPFFGDPNKPGSDETHLGSTAHGMAADGKGNLLICDPANKRVVVVSEADGKFVGSFPAEAPEFLAVNRETGEIYLLKLAKGGTADVVKLSGWKDPRPLASIHLSAPRRYLRWCFAADTGAKPAALWASNGWQLFRFEDAGGEFRGVRQVGPDKQTKVEPAVSRQTVGDGGFVNLTVDHYRDDPEIYVRSGRYGYNYRWTRYGEKTGKIETIGRIHLNSDATGSCLEVGPDGNLYLQGWPQFLYKFDRSGRPLKWDVPFAPPAGIKPYAKPTNAIFVPVCMVFMTHTHGIRADGHHFLFERWPTAPARSPKALYEYAASGKRVGGPIIWGASDAVIGPRFDQQGNIYIAEAVRPADQLIPSEFAAFTGPVTRKSTWEQGDPRGIAARYGSILKFSPKGGMISYQKHYSGQVSPKHAPRAYAGPPKLDPSLKTVDAACFAAGSSEFTFAAAKITGAEWMHFGVSQIFIGGCNCENTRFDVDLYGRVWYPDLARYRVGVLDTNGNLITTFGSYGNAESCGPDSPVVDPSTGKVRPRRADDPKDLKSPFAEPEIAFSWLIGVGATDTYAYMGDSLNRRLLRARLTYAAEETCEIK